MSESEEDLLLFPFDAHDEVRVEGTAPPEPAVVEPVAKAERWAEPVVARVHPAGQPVAKAEPAAARAVVVESVSWAEAVEEPVVALAAEPLRAPRPPRVTVKPVPQPERATAPPAPRDEAQARVGARLSQLEDVVSRFQIILEHTQGRLDDDIQRLRQTVDRLSASVEDLTMSRDVVFRELGADMMAQRLVTERAKGAAKPRAQQARYAGARTVEQGARPPQQFGGRRRNAADNFRL